ncbi:MAG: ABC transporter permease [Bacteriovoracaceae bacterium]|nr:ABC transporter permease [Bacteriovoracaceae bacterium]
MIKTWLKGTSLLYKKEIKDSFLSPFVYILSGLFIALGGWVFFSLLVSAKNATEATLTASVLIPSFSLYRFILMIICPLLTMRLLSEEKKNHTIELLYLSDLNNSQIIFSKFLSSLTIVVFMLGLTTLFPAILGFSGYSDWGVVLSGYGGLVLLCMAYISIGLFASSLSSNYVICLVLAIFMMLGLWFLVLSAGNTDNYLVGLILRYFSETYHFESFARGTVRSFNFVYFFSFVTFFMFLTGKSLNSRRW